jgi:phospholipid transport system substrate-binding protein
MSLARRALMMLAVAGLIAAAPSTVPARAADPGRAEGFVRDLGERAITTLKEKDRPLATREQALGDILRVGFDLPLIARLALGASFRQLSEQQRTDYESVFADFVLVTYSRRLNAYAGEELVVVGAQPLTDSDVVVSSQIKRVDGPPIKVDWRVRESGEELRIIDVIVEGVSMVLTQRNEFQSIAQQRGIDGLLTLLQSRVDEVSAQPPGSL